jgi:large subunit ribosomal protein L4
MLKTTLYTAKGEKKGEASLPDSVFGLDSNDTLLHQVYVAISANLRTVIAHTKDRGERRGSGKKPWKQKGTGRARAGAVRNPLWRKGGVAFGPTNDRNFTKQTNKKMRRKATLIALSEKARSEKIRVIDTFTFESAKTKLFASMLKKVAARPGRVLALFAPEERELMRLSRNIMKVENVLTQNVSVFDLLNAEYLILSEQSVKLFEERAKEAGKETVKPNV